MEPCLSLSLGLARFLPLETPRQTGGVQAVELLDSQAPPGGERQGAGGHGNGIRDQSPLGELIWEGLDQALDKEKKATAADADRAFHTTTLMSPTVL